MRKRLGRRKDSADERGDSLDEKKEMADEREETWQMKGKRTWHTEGERLADEEETQWTRPSG